MVLCTRRILVMVVLSALLCAPHVHAKSVYAIPDHWPPYGNSEIAVYTILADPQAGQLERQSSEQSFTLNYGGAADIDIDCESSMLFITFEGQSRLELYNARDMTHQGMVQASGASDLAGLIVNNMDPADTLVYTVDRGTDHLYVYDWDAESKTLTLQPPDPDDPNNPNYPTPTNWHKLRGGGGDPSVQAYGLALDQTTGILYVSQYNSTVHTYDTTEPYFGHLGTLDMEQAAMDLAVDEPNGYLYAGGYQAHPYLIRKSLTPGGDPNLVKCNVIGTGGAGVIGLAVDQDSGLVYMTTYRTVGSNNTIEVWDTSDPNVANWARLDTETQDVSGPAGICVPRTNITYKPSLMDLEKTDDVPDGQCVSPGEEITYTIRYRPDEHDHHNVVVTDTLPLEVGLVSADPNDFDYQLDGESGRWQVIWEEGAVSAWDPNDPDDPNVYLTLTVEVLSTAVPLGTIENFVEIESDISYTTATEITDVCCWGGDVIYVAAGNDGLTGTSWADAYGTLEQALARSAAGCGTEIWVARGTYVPPAGEDGGFAIHDGLRLYGGFMGTETSRDQRDFIRNRTVLEGEGEHNVVVDPNGAGLTETTIIDGFVVTGAIEAGISVHNCGPNLHIANCLAEYNGREGLRTYYSDPNITACSFQHNGSDGIGCYEGDLRPRFSRCKVQDNDGHGLYTSGVGPTVLNTFLNRNVGDGIRVEDPNTSSIVRNCTLTANTGQGIVRTAGSSVAVSNCILWANNPNGGSFGEQKEGCALTYSCLYDPNDVPGSSTPDPTTHNITCDPGFAYGDPNLSGDFHLAADSECINRGHNNVGNLEHDLDGDPRQEGSYVDMGADEVCCTNTISHLWDFNADGVIGLHEYAVLAAAWLSIDPNYTTDPNYSATWDPRCDFDINHTVELPDLALLVEPNTWLWEACWRLDRDMTWMMMAGRGGGTSGLTAEPLSTEALEAARYARWLAIRPPYEPTLLQQIWQLEDLIAWAVDLWMTDETVQKEMSEEDFKVFLNELYETLSDLRLRYLCESTGQPPEAFQPWP